MHDLSWPKYPECTDGCNCATKLEAYLPCCKFLPESVQLRLYTCCCRARCSRRTFPFKLSTLYKLVSRLPTRVICHLSPRWPNWCRPVVLKLSHRWLSPGWFVAQSTVAHADGLSPRWLATLRDSFNDVNVYASCVCSYYYACNCFNDEIAFLFNCTLNRFS